MTRRAKVAILIDTATTWGSGLIEGIAEYANSVEDWQCFLGPRRKSDRLMLPENWDGDGVIARVTHQDLAEQLVARRIPAVDVSWYGLGEGRIPRCTCDEVSIAELAANYYIERGFRQFAYCPSNQRPNYVDRFGQAFIDTLKRRTYACHAFAPTDDVDSYLPSPSELARMVQWLKQLPKPVGLLAFDSVQARQVTESCQLAGIDVPHEVAVLGGEHDLLSCTISKPQLSSIDHSPRRVGWTAAQLLARLMAGEPAPAVPILLPAARVITRQSTDTMAVSDDLLASAVQFIKENSFRRIQVSDILVEVPISRRALEKGFRKCLGRSPAQEIRRVRVDHAVQLLCDTSWAMPRIAMACGFERPELLTRAFRRELKTTPSEFRKQHLKERQQQAASVDGATPRFPRRVRG
ncbi:MAG: DNA-binding transcriptional regulator [Pirellulales bacterium]|nr:DNA-binding transcriptional regulator [Pirellulales bacterium]